MKRPQKLAVMLVPTPPYEICGLTVQILAAVAEDEARRISERTKAALARAKARGTELGANGKVLAKRNRREALEHARILAPIIDEIRQTGITTIRGIAAELNINTKLADIGIAAACSGSCGGTPKCVTMGHDRTFKSAQPAPSQNERKVILTPRHSHK